MLIHLQGPNHLSFSSLLYFGESHADQSTTTKSTWFLLGSLVSRISCRSISRERIILVSIRFSSFASLMLIHLQGPNHLSFSSLLYFRKSHADPSPGSESSLFLLASLLSQVSYRSISRDEVILVSPRFSTFARLMQIHLQGPNFLVSLHFSTFASQMQIHLQGTNHLSFSWLLYFSESHADPYLGTETS